MDFNTEKFILEIQKRPEIWNTKCSKYSDKMSKLKVWQELTDVYGAELSDDKKKELGSNLQKKWRNIRDCFVKAHKAKYTGTGSKAEKRNNSYVFYDKLLFLQETVCNHVTCNINAELNNIKPAKDDDSSSQSSDLRDESRRKRRKKSNEDLVDRELIFFNKNTGGTIDDEDEDRLFFLSLVKEFKKIPEPLRIQAKLDLLKVIRDAQYGECLKMMEYTNSMAYPGNMAFSISTPCTVTKQEEPQEAGILKQEHSPSSNDSENS